MADKDIAPGLIDKVNKEFDENLAKDKKATALKDKLERGSASYKDAYAYAESVGNARAKAFGDQINSDVLPEGKMHYNIASRLLEDSLTTDHDMVAEYAAGVQKAYNEKAGIGLKALEPDVDQDRIDGFIEGVCNADNYDDVAWKLAEPVVTHARSVVDDTIKKNAEFQYKAGVNATVTRDADSKCCEWCSDLAGDYVYPKVPREVFQRHDNCKCTVDYNGRRLTAYNPGGSWGSHTFRDQGEQERIDSRKESANEASPMKRNASTEWAGKPQAHSKNEIADLRQLAAEKGIILDQSFQSFDGDIELVKDFVTVLNDNVNGLSHMRKDKARVSLSYTLDDATYAITHGANVTINGFAFRDRNILSKDYEDRVIAGWFTQGSTYLDIATHESAHVIIYLDQLKTARVIENVFGLDMSQASDEISEVISEYATKNKDELIAESYVMKKNGSNEAYILKVIEYCGILK